MCILSNRAGLRWREIVAILDGPTLFAVQASRGGPDPRAPRVQIRDIVRFLNEAHVRATYGAVAELIGGIPRGIGARLTALYSRSPEASWIVSAESGMPTGYAASERHPALLNKTEIISSGRELEQRMAAWTSPVAADRRTRQWPVGDRPFGSTQGKMPLIRRWADQHTNSIQRSAPKRRITPDHVRTICSMFSGKFGRGERI
ncbi:MAG TPA: hypothetical protein VEL51_17265 [Vicinamibacterales bacterium]|nr:hypothetical protein [Vicinamibacterales bacterium]